MPKDIVKNRKEFVEMKLRDVRKTMAATAILTEGCSLPFITETDGKLRAHWFNYRIKKEEKGASICTDKVFTTEDGFEAQIDAVNLVEKLPLMDTIAEDMSQQEYYSCLENLIGNYSSGEMKKLLDAAAFKPFLNMYHAVYSYCVNKNSEDATEEEKNISDIILTSKVPKESE